MIHGNFQAVEDFMMHNSSSLASQVYPQLVASSNIPKNHSHSNTVTDSSCPSKSFQVAEHCAAIAHSTENPANTSPLWSTMDGNHVSNVEPAEVLTSLTSIQTTDVFTKPPMNVCIPLSIVEETVGLQLLRAGQLTQTPSICFQHGYGKCKGRDGISASTCRQIHVQKKSLWELRRGYDTSNRFVRPLCRTIKVLLPDCIRTSQAQYTNLRYMEFCFEHTSPTAGRTFYLNRYTTYLLSEDAQATFPLMEYLCTEFALSGSCPTRELCLFVHALPHHAISRRERLQRWKENSRGSNVSSGIGGASSCSSNDGSFHNRSTSSDDFENILQRFAQCFHPSPQNASTGESHFASF